MSKICIVSCVKSKKKGIHKAKDLYGSSLFKKSMKYADRICDETYILSAKYGLISPEKKIKSYDVSIGTIPWQEKWKWKEKAAKDIMRASKDKDVIVFLTGHSYKVGVAGQLKKREVEYPMAHMKIGQRLKWLKEQLETEGKNET